MARSAYDVFETHELKAMLANNEISEHDKPQVINLLATRPDDEK